MYQKLIDYLEAAIAAGHLKPGGRLPPLRELCRQFSLSMGTVQRAIAQLEERGLVEGKRGSEILLFFASLFDLPQCGNIFHTMTVNQKGFSSAVRTSGSGLIPKFRFSAFFFGGSESY